MNLAGRLRLALAAPPAQPLLAGDLIEGTDGNAVAAAVLIALTDRDEPGVVLTVRREHMRTHAGQIAFPGGRLDLGESAVEAALCEAREEVGLEPSLVQVIGQLQPYRTVTAFAVTPVVAVIPPDLPLVAQDSEVAEWFEAPLAYLIDPAKQRLEAAMFRGRERDYYVIEWNGRRIWGATAAMLVNLSRQLEWA
ncbi:MAG: CoA pyrophosphatase [Pseudomonadota bacterium]|nr:CoA pyrophosphatase [Sphingomonas sp.]MDQ3478117.1 CoA pyrophosphatase [Pseudomonadota bacterium]